LFVNVLILASSSSPFIDAYNHSDFLGKCIYLGLILASVICWTLLIYKTIFIRSARNKALRFQILLNRQKGNLLKFESEAHLNEKGLNPFYEIYASLRKQTIDLLKKNHHFLGEKEGASYLSPTDIDYVEANLVTIIAGQTKEMDKHLFILSTIVGLAPLMGLLGTVWGILISFSQMQSQAAASSNQMVLGGIALALTTTVLGLLTAIPALIAYNYLKNSIRNFETEMEGFSNDLLSSVEMRYRKVDLKE
jgi:biopolymer transport protein TolQ